MFCCRVVRKRFGISFFIILCLLSRATFLSVQLAASRTMCIAYSIREHSQTSTQCRYTRNGFGKRTTVSCAERRSRDRTMHACVCMHRRYVGKGGASVTFMRAIFGYKRSWLFPLWFIPSTNLLHKTYTAAAAAEKHCLQNRWRKKCESTRANDRLKKKQRVGVVDKSKQDLASAASYIAHNNIWLYSRVHFKLNIAVWRFFLTLCRSANWCCYSCIVIFFCLCFLF